MPSRWHFAAISLVVTLWAGATVASGQDAARARQVYQRAVDLEGRGNDSAALALLWQAAGLAPHDAEVQNRLGEALTRLGALEASIDAFTRAVAERPAFHKAANNLILALVQAGRGPEALERARAMVAAAPRDPNPYFTLGLAQADQDVEAAIATFRRVLELAPRHALAAFNLALVLQRADRLPEAIEQLGRAIQIEPRAEAHYALGVIYWHQGDSVRAERALRAAISAREDYAAAHSTLGAVLRDRRDWAAAATALRRAIALRPDLPGAHVTLARVLQLAGDRAGAATALAEGERLRQRGQRQHAALVMTAVGTGKLHAGNLTGALDDFRRATALCDDYAPAHYQLGLALARLGANDASQAAFARAKQLNPNLVATPFRP